MVVMDSLDRITQYDSLSEREQQNLQAYFESHGQTGIIEFDDHKYCTYRQLLKGIEPLDIRIEYSPDMFVIGKYLIQEFDYAIAMDADEEPVCVLSWYPTTYNHAYKYTGGADLWFLNQYNCLFLHGCNEYSVELCLSALRLWHGNRLVLVGTEWMNLIPSLPDLPGIDCYYEEELTPERVTVLVSDTNYLYITTGIPHEEPMDRYDHGIMYYDEVMSFTFLFSDYQQLGTENADKHFFVMNGWYGDLGLFALFHKAEIGARYAKSKGYIPVISLKTANKSIYQNASCEDVWEKFYHQPESYTLEEVMNSRHVHFAPTFYNGSIQCAFMKHFGSSTQLSWPNGIYNDAVWSYINERRSIFLPYPDKTLGVLIRGTDYAHSQIHNHSIHATKEMVGDKIDEVLNSWEGLEYIYLATEDASYCDYFKIRYGNKIYFTDQQRFCVKSGELLATMHKNNEKKRDGFLLGVEYILSIHLLSQCRCLIASGNCGGVNEALKENHGNYEHTYIFELGVNP